MKPARFATVADATWTCELVELERDELRAENARQAETIAKLQLACRGVLQFADRLPDHTTVALREALKGSQ